MASVYYLFDDALQVADDIIVKYSQQDENLKENHYAATIIQRTYRRYIARKSYTIVIDAAMILQKYIRGWLVRYHLPDFMQEHWDRLCLRRYNREATKLQAIWKGILLRREIDIKKVLNAKKAAAMDYRLLMEYEAPRQSLDENIPVELPAEENIVPFGGTTHQAQEFAIKLRIIDLMYNRHHLLSTKHIQGILSTTPELKQIEKILRSVSWKAYMNRVKKLNYKYHKKEGATQKSSYMFENKRMQKKQDILRLRDKTHDIKEQYMGDFITDDRKRFVLHSKIVQPPYEKSIIYHEDPYRRRETNVVRDKLPSRNISKTDFIFALKEIVRECKIPTYYIDFWYKECIGHNFIE